MSEKIIPSKKIHSLEDARNLAKKKTSENVFCVANVSIRSAYDCVSLWAKLSAQKKVVLTSTSILKVVIL